MLTGNDGPDVAIFVGDKSEYTITIDSDSFTVIVTDSVADRDGIDTLQTVEQLQFADQIIKVEELSGGIDTGGKSIYLPLILR